jgi:hypothetical protein
MSVPPGTEMFQFPGFASNTYEFSAGYPLRGGLPHSDIRGSTIARISPRLFAACHVLHRLLAPRHPPDALLFLTSTHRPDRTRDAAGTAGTHTTFRIHLSKNSSADAGLGQHPRGQRSTSRSRKGRRGMEAIGFEPTTPCLQSRRSPAELRPHHGNGPSCKRRSAPTTTPPAAAMPRLLPQAAEPAHRSLRGISLGRRPRKMGQGGLEPPTPRLSSVCSNQLSY